MRRTSCVFIWDTLPRFIRQCGWLLAYCEPFTFVLRNSTALQVISLVGLRQRVRETRHAMAEVVVLIDKG